MVCFVSNEVIKNYKLNNRSIPNRYYSIQGKSKEKLEKNIVILSQKRLIIPVGRTKHLGLRVLPEIGEHFQNARGTSRK